MIYIVAAAMAFYVDQPAASSLSCGEVCVELLCIYYKLPYDREAVRRDLRLGSFGEASLQNLSDCLARRGFRCQVVRGRLDALHAATGPTVLLMRSPRPDGSAAKDVGHFAVVSVVPGRRQLLAFDPFSSPEPILVDERNFAANWTGLALLASPAQSSWDRGWLWIPCSAALGTVLALLPRHRARPALV
jgi:ABC-type bacteriocin/lantibiotic exporter with double-glycine peptidase domain